MVLGFITGFLDWLFVALPGNPVYTVLIIGAIVYFANVVIRGKTDPIKIFKALRGDLTTSFIIIFTFLLISSYFMHISEKQYFLLPTVSGTVFGFIFGNWLRALARVGK
jgi:hypothetical protein